MQLTPKIGYAPASLADFLTRLSERNKSQAERNGLFASHPETKERIAKIGELARAAKTTATVEPRYKANIKYQPTEITSIAVVTEGSAGLAGSSDSEQGAAEEGRAEKGRRPWSGLEADRGAGKTVGAGVGVGRCPRRRPGSRWRRVAAIRIS